jgi:hypothetical protein
MLLVRTPALPRLLDWVRDEIRLRHYSIRTEQTYALDRKYPNADRQPSWPGAVCASRSPAARAGPT